MKTVAPAKINLTLEVLGRQDDGYHEIRSVMQTIDLCDEVQVTRAPDLLAQRIAPDDPPPGTLVGRMLPHKFYWAGQENLADPDSGVIGESVIRAVQLLDPDGQKDARVNVRKNIPVAAGLGGGSSDAAAALRVLQQLWALGWKEERLAETAAQIGSDVPFFLWGGTALVAGRGERVTPLPDAQVAWLVLLAPPIKMPEKTKRMYESLRVEDFNDGSRSEALSGRSQQGMAVRVQDLYNVFENRAFERFEGLETYRDALTAAGAQAVHLAGAGPALFSFAESEAAALKLMERVDALEAKVFVARTLGAAEATAIVE